MAAPKRRGTPRSQPAACGSAGDSAGDKGGLRPRNKRRRRGPTAGAQAQAMTGYRALQALTRKRVRDDGSCWVYVVLAGVGLCDHAITSAAYARRNQNMLPDPSPRDRAVDGKVRELLFSKHREAFGFDEAVLRTPNYALFEAETEPTEAEVKAKFFGSYGGMRREFPALAVEFRVEIALWDENAQDRLKDPESLWQLACADGQVLQLTAAQIMERTSTKIHVAWSDQIPDHFECYVDAKVGKAYVAPDWLRPLL